MSVDYAVSIGQIFGLISSVIVLYSRITRLETNQKNLMRRLEKMEDLKLDVDIAELKTQLKNVEARLAEILAILKRG